MSDDEQPAHDPRARYLELLKARGDRPMLDAAERQFEQERLRWLLTRMGLKSYAGRIAGLHRERTGLYELHFSTFNEFLPTFPFLLGSSRLQGIEVPWPTTTDQPRRTPVDYHVHTDGYSTEPARFKKFGWVPFVAAYEAFYNNVHTKQEVRRIALIFPRKGFLHGMVIHDDETEQYWRNGLCWVYKATTGSRLYVQPFSALVDGIYAKGRGWRPEGEH